MKQTIAILLGLSLTCSANAMLNQTLSQQDQVSAIFEQAKQQPSSLQLFLDTMPKGGDLHIHRSGAAYAENLIRYGQKDNICVDEHTLTPHASKTCNSGVTLADLPKDEALYNRVVDSWSMRSFVEGHETNEQHFFGIFPRIYPVTSDHGADTLAEILNRGAKQHEIYMEPMLTTMGDKAMEIGSQVEWNQDLSVLRQQLMKQGIPELVNEIQAKIKSDTNLARQKMHCGTDKAEPGCNMTFRYEYLAVRDVEPKLVFAQLLTAFELAKRDPQIVAVNLVAPEDSVTALRDYHLQMLMMNYLHGIYPGVNIALHAGELSPSVVTPADLSYHIADAVHMGNAQRIGHGVDIAGENNANNLLAEMAAKHIPVEINLTSNDTLLHVSGDRHPLPLYLSKHVPVVLATDDEGILRTNITREYQRAIETYDLDYPTVKTIVRNSITYSFMPGNSLWDNAETAEVVKACRRDNLGDTLRSKSCDGFLQNNAKARLQWRLESQFNNFETSIVKQAALVNHG
ncbi:MAG: adenosine deaminase [Legionellales bacterium]|nr:adenosine deaminase [Legionellales bacterium]|tara:strand:+ start:17520 stop:19061 length:1542 start_codon:yes stop_codon:yes gene_type:complete